MKEPARDNQSFRRPLDVLDARARCHPLCSAIGNQSPAAGSVLMLECTIHHVRYGLETAVRVPGGAFGLAWSVLDRPHLV